MSRGILLVQASLPEVPTGHAWLSEAERAVLDALRVPKRREEWRLGRWVAKAAAGAVLGDAVPMARLSILADRDGAPRVVLDGRRAPVSISLSHRDGTAVGAAAPPGIGVGCDIELVEARSPAFVEDFLADPERAMVAAAPPERRASLVTLAWSGKESALKVLRTGLRSDTRSVIARLPDPANGEGAGSGAGGRWRPLAVETPSGLLEGWWREAGRHVVAVMADRPLGPPEVRPSPPAGG